MLALVVRKHKPSSTGDIALMRGNFRAVYFALFVLFLFSHNALAEPAVSIERDGDTIRILAKLRVDAHHHIAWQVLTDYNNLAQFVPGMQVSRIVSKPGEPMLLKQIGQSGFLMLTFPVEVVTQITEIQLESIRFLAVSGNLKSQSGEWRIKQEGDRTLVIYQSRIVPGFWVPPLIGPAVISQDVGGKMIGIAEEMQRRAASVILEKSGQVMKQRNDL